jgi:transposase
MLSISALVRKKALLVRLGWFRLVHVKSDVAQEIRMLLVNRNLLLGKLQDIENLLRGSLKVFGLRLGKVTKWSFETRALELVEAQSYRRVGTERGCLCPICSHHVAIF